MAKKNPHELEKDIRGLSMLELTGRTETTIPDQIVQLVDLHGYDTGNSQDLHAIEKAIKEYNRRIVGITGVGVVTDETGKYFTDPVNAGFLPNSITGFFDLRTNQGLFQFFTQGTNGYLYGFRRINPDYTGYACRVRRMYDLAEVDVKFDDQGIVSPESEVDIAVSGFGTGLKPTEKTLTGFCFPEYLPGGIIDSEFCTSTISKLYQQRVSGAGSNVPLTGQHETSRLTHTATVSGVRDKTYPTGEVFSLDLSNFSQGTYMESADTDFGGSDKWHLFSGVEITISGKGIMFPAYTRERNGGYETLFMFPENAKTLGFGGVRWVVRGVSLFGVTANERTYVEQFRHESVSTGKSTNAMGREAGKNGNAYSNATITGTSTNRPFEFTSWSVTGQGQFDTDVTFSFTKETLNTQPVIATGGKGGGTVTGHMAFSQGSLADKNLTGILGMQFKAEGNASHLRPNNLYYPFTSEATMGWVVQLDTTGTDQTVFHQGTQTGVFIEGLTSSISDGAYLVYGTHYAPAGKSWKARFYNDGDHVNTIFRTKDSEFTDNGITDSGNNTDKHYIQMHFSADDGHRGELEFDGITKQQSGKSSFGVTNSTQPFASLSSVFGCRRDRNGDFLEEPLDGTIYEMIFFDNDAQADPDELARYTGKVRNYHNI